MAGQGRVSVGKNAYASATAGYREMRNEECDSEREVRPSRRDRLGAREIEPRAASLEAPSAGRLDVDWRSRSFRSRDSRLCDGARRL